MAAEEPPDETTVNDRWMVTVPAAIRNRLDIQPGDKLRWRVDDDEGLVVDVVQQRYGAFDEDDMKAEMGGDSLETVDLAGYEDDPSFSEEA